MTGRRPVPWSVLGVAVLILLLGTPRTRAQTPSGDQTSAAEGREAPPTCAELRDEIDDDALESWLRAEGGVFDEILADPERYRAQVLVREVVSREEADDCLIRRGFRVDAEYVYPASAIKTVAAIEALELATRSRSADDGPELGLDSVLWYRRPDDFENLEESSREWKRGGTLREIVDETLVVSSNAAFNKLYDLVGHERLNRGMWEAGLKSVRLQHRMFSKRTVEEQKWSPEVAVQVGENESGEPKRAVIRPERRSELQLPEMPIGGVKVGESHTSFITGEFHETPMDFATKNYISIDDLQRLMLGLYRPEIADEVDFSDLGDHRDFLATTLGKHPRADSEEKLRELRRRFSPMDPGFADTMDRDRFAYRNKAGRAYGFHLDNAYVRDRRTGREVFVTAAIYVNENRELNDNDYEYDERSYPFFAGVGRAVAKHVLTR